MKKTYLSVFVLLCGFLTGPSQVIASHFEESPPCHYSPVYLYWTGEEDNDFFNERNWRQTTQRPARMDTATERSMDVGSAKPTCLPDAFGSSYLICLNDHELTKDKRPVPGTLSPGKPIEVNLYVSAAVIKVDEPLVFACERKGLMLSNSQLILPAGIERGVIAMDQESTLKVSASDLSPTAFFDFLDAASWVYWNGMTPDVIGETLEGQIMRQGTEASPNVDYRINQYYQTGSLIRPRDEAFAPLMIFSEVALGGRRGELTEMKIYRGAEIPNGMNDQCRSFILKRGYMATFAVEPNGTGKSKVFIASEEDMVLENIPEALEGNVSFIRVVPWNWVTKKGTGGFYDQLNAGWYYNWGLGAGSRPNYENVPMAWGAGGASPASVKTIIERENVTHFLGFNESDHCTSQSGQFNNLCQPEVAVAYFEGLMGSGLRIGSPAPRENGPFTWLKEFYRIAKERDVRFDFVAVH